MNTVAVSRGNRILSADASQCAGCLSCMLHCSFRFGSKFNLSNSRIAISRLVGQDHEFAISFSGECDACLICAGHCPYQALTAETAGKAV